jgi:hypothetical protein
LLDCRISCQSAALKLSLTATTTTHEDVMIGNAMRAVAVAAAVTFFGFAALAKTASYDGAWHMQLVTTSGHCGVINIGMAVKSGNISATSGKS